MGTRYNFICPACKYEPVISGRRDRGQMFGTTTISCSECGELYDVRVTGDHEDPGKVFDPEWTLPPPSCPKSADHSVEEWHYPGPCPKCGRTMEKLGTLEQKWD